MSNILERIVARKRLDLQSRREKVPAQELERRLAQAPPVRDFRLALEKGPNLGIIAEVKKASPSAGVLRADFDPIAIAQIYAVHGAAAISVLTDEPFFQGSFSYLTNIRRAVTPPVLCKDFILEDYQILEARCAGADAVLLIAEILDDRELSSLLARTHELGMQALVELYDPAHLPRIVAAGARIIGVNNRDLRTFVTRLEQTLDIAPQLPAGTCLVSESGIRGRADMERLQAAGVKAVLVGESLMRAADIGAKLRELRGEL
jgi:indole-3-glycerol phosphate synthase